MYVFSCRRCGETGLTQSESSRAVECAGERGLLCVRCHDELRAWLGGAEFAPEEASPAGRAGAPSGATR